MMWIIAIAVVIALFWFARELALVLSAGGILFAGYKFMEVGVHASLTVILMIVLTVLVCLIFAFFENSEV